MNTPLKYKIREKGRNGYVIIDGIQVVRTIPKRLGKDDILSIPIRTIGHVHHDRRRSTDIVRITTITGAFEWKVTHGDWFVTELNAAIANL